MKMWCFSLCLFFVFVDICYGLTGVDCSPQDGYTCEMYNFSKNNCSPSYLTTIFPEEFYQINSTEYPGQPGSIGLNITYKLHNSTYVPQVILSFKTPKDVGKNYVKGFEVSRYDLVNMYQSVNCYIYNLSTVTWKKNSFDEMKRFEIIDHCRAYNHSESNSEVSAMDWIATIYYVKQELEHSILVNVTSPPKRFGLTKMEYSLINSVTGKRSIEILPVTTNSYTFRNVVSGSYIIGIKPIGPIQQDSYITVLTAVFNFSAATTILVQPSTMTQLTTTNVPTVSTAGTETHTASLTISINNSKKPQASSNLNVALIISIVSLAVGITGGIFAFECYHKWHNSKAPITAVDKGSGVNPNFNYTDGVETYSIISDQAGNNNEQLKNKPDKLPLKKRPKLFLLYEEDHEYHRKVVDKFASYLQMCCHCDVMCAEWQLDASWVHQDLQQADYAVIVNSEGAYYTYFSDGSKNMPVLQQQSPPISKGLSSINSIKNKFIHKGRYDNIVMIYFEYTDEKFMLPDICSGFKYQIPKHFTDFLLHIDKLHCTSNLAQYDLPLDGNHNWKPLGQEFLAALAEASQYQRDNQHWAVNRFGYNRGLSNDDSQHDSDLPDEVKTQSSKKETNDYKCQTLMDHLDTTSQGAITINPSDITIGPDGFTLVPYELTSFPKQRLIHSLHSFNQISSVPSGDTDFCKFNFISPDDTDEFDTVSKSQSDQLKSFIDRYQVFHDLEAQEVDSEQKNKTASAKGYNRNDDLLILKVHSGEIPFIATDLVSLGGESI